jgi:nucleotide-binding universal stress UspA family protein
MYRQVLVPLEGDAGPTAHLLHATELAAEEGAQLTVLRVITVIPSDEYVLERIQIEEGSVGAKSKAAAKEHVDQLEAKLQGEGVNARGVVIVSDQAEDEAIVAYAAEMDSDLIVLPNRRRSLFSRWLQGNVTAKVQRRSNIPVLMVREQ